MGNLIQGIVDFPIISNTWPSFIGKFVYWLISSIHNGGIIGYGFAIIIFTVLIKLMLMPLDFGNRYFTKKNSMQMAALKPEEDALKEQYGSDFLALSRAQSALRKKNGYSMGGFCLFTLLNMALTLIIFISVFTALRDVSTYNMKITCNELQQVYMNHKDDVTDPGFTADINSTYNKRSISFFWIKNIWKADTPWEKSYLTFSEYSSYVNNPTADLTDDTDYIWTYYGAANESALILYFQNTYPEKYASTPPTQAQMKTHYVNDLKKSQYDAIFSNLSPKHKRSWNGLLLLIALAGITTYLSAILNSKIMSAKKKEETVKETKAQYSMRTVKNQTDKPTTPTIDPKMMGNIMKFVLPLVMIFFTMSNTAALAIYIIASSIISTAITVGLNHPVNRLVEWQEKRRKLRGDTSDEPDPSIINPHAKYFKQKKPGK